ncbi:Crp/Fnr family transcriptional regulator [Gilvimarinus agarilyticus]|uniref:CRP/FNR family transcriptional regulator, anaerobic regulatory protein n=1 Tax=Reichenbachiella agariperforans TaxID=156994 RepID=A0A1M6W021_REIAG|nr:Crp/Fnr family transcriptional regulator [Reichenbachiella agariperforans]MBU2885871.1 Crp/Fnr family transcriptional regulator [Gilvimarinus agarilyticus]MBU2915254.1 Crp/Fnr family transcriptional regulator [Reichenbachiella agariperforans]SHK87112.1 CRP/FNR family transcriptional regulator, anaerobic regulatory protein [Reichenbachiella agariperforans]
MRELLQAQFGRIFQKELVDEIEAKGVLKTLEAGTALIDYGKYIKSIPLVMTGTIKIVREDDKGNELFLYYLRGGDTCAMSLTCCTSQKKSEIKAIVESDAVIVMVPLQYMDEWMRFSSWRQFVFASYNARFDEMLSALDAVAFMKLDERLLNYLLDIKANTGSFEIKRTHQEIANDLGTSRVVISRLLKRLADEDQIELHRNKIEIL